MKIIDRYILKEFLVPLFYCLLAFFMLYIVADLFQNLDDFLEIKMSPLSIALYYFYFLPFVLVLTVPFAVMLGLLYELGNLGKHNELAALRASGISLTRIVTPLLFSALILSCVVLLVSETVLPISNYHSERLRSLYEEKTPEQLNEAITDVTFYSIEHNYIIFIKKLYPKEKTAQGILIKSLYTNGNIKNILRAQKGKWLDGTWWTFNGNITRYDEEGHISSDIEHFLKRESLVRESPDDIGFQKKEIENLNYFSFRHYLHKQFGNKIPKDKLVDLNYKLSFPFVTFVIALLVVPFGMRIKRAGMLAAMGWGIGLALLFYGLILISLASGKQGYLSPFLAAWLPHLVFATAGSILLFTTK